MKHGIEQLSTTRPVKGYVGVMSHLKGHLLSALNDLEFWCLVSIGVLLLLH
jgi:hypothetical protein